MVKLQLTTVQKKLRTYLILFAFLLFSIILLGLFWLYTSPSETVGYALAYAAGLSMIVLPCTLPLVFIIVPLSMGKNYKKGLMMALLFGLGLSITISIYGIIISFVGQFLGVDRATQIMWAIAGLAAFIFGISELNLIKWKMPGFAARTPKIIENKGDYFKSFFLGLFLGNAGIGCPNPAFYVLLTYIAGIGSITTGGLLAFIHGVGRATPLIFIAILAILGISATKTLVKRRIQVEKITGWGLIGIGSFILMLGIFGHAFWERSPIHLVWNKFIQSLGITPEITLGGQEILLFPWLLMILLVILVVIWKITKNKINKKKSKIINIIFIAVIIITIVAGFLSQTIKSVEEVHGPSKEFNVAVFQWGFDPQIIRVNKGDVVTLHVTSTDVGHGIASSEFGFNEVIRPGETVDIQFVADQAGVFKFYCSLVCGIGHDDQKGFLVVEDPDGPSAELQPIQSNYIDTSPLIDGNIDDLWSNVPENSLLTRFLGSEKPVLIKSLHNQDNIYFLVRWNDDDRNNDSTSPTDRVAIQLDIAGGSEISMGAAGVPHIKEEQKTIGQGIVDIWHWKAYDSHSEQENVVDDEFAGPFPELKEHYYRDDDDKYGGINNLQAQGLYSETAQEWVVEFSRPLTTSDVGIDNFGSLDKQLSVANEYAIAFAIWDGGEGQDAGEHQVTDWGIVKINK